MPSVRDQEGAFLVAPRQAGVAHAAVDLGLHVDPEQGRARGGAFVGDPEPLDVLARRLRPGHRAGQVRAGGGEVRDHHPDRAVPPTQLGHEQVRGPLVALDGLPGQSLGEPVQAAADGQPADDRPEVGAAGRQVPLAGANVGVEPDGGEVDVVGRAPRVHPRGHRAVADQSLGGQRDGLGAVREVGPDDHVLGRAVLRLPPDAPGHRAVAQPRPDRLGRDRDVPERVDPLILKPVGRQRAERGLVGGQLEPDLLLELDRVGADDHDRPHPRADRSAVATLGRRLDPGRDHHHPAWTYRNREPRAPVAGSPLSDPAPLAPRGAAEVRVLNSQILRMRTSPSLREIRS